MFVTNILDEFKENSEKEYIKLSVNRKSFVVRLSLDDNNKPQAQIVTLREAKSKQKDPELRLKSLQETVSKNPGRVFIEPDNETLGILCFSKVITLPKLVDKYQWMTAKESYEWLLLKSIGL